MENKKDSPGVYIPPPLIYVLIFLAAVFIQKKIPIDASVFHLQVTKIVGILLLVTSLFFLITSLTKFFQSKTPPASLPQLAQGVIVQPCHPNLRLGYLSLCLKIVSEVVTLA